MTQEVKQWPAQSEANQYIYAHFGKLGIAFSAESEKIPVIEGDVSYDASKVDLFIDPDIPITGAEEKSVALSTTERADIDSLMYPWRYSRYWVSAKPDPENPEAPSKQRAVYIKFFWFGDKVVYEDQVIFTRSYSAGERVVAASVYDDDTADGGETAFIVTGNLKHWLYYGGPTNDWIHAYYPTTLFLKGYKVNVKTKVATLLWTYPLGTWAGDYEGDASYHGRGHMHPNGKKMLMFHHKDTGNGLIGVAFTIGLDGTLVEEFTSGTSSQSSNSNIDNPPAESDSSTVTTPGSPCSTEVSTSTYSWAASSSGGYSSSFEGVVAVDYDDEGNIVTISSSGSGGTQSVANDEANSSYESTRIMCPVCTSASGGGSYGRSYSAQSSYEFSASYSLWDGISVEREVSSSASNTTATSNSETVVIDCTNSETTGGTQMSHTWQSSEVRRDLWLLDIRAKFAVFTCMSETQNSNSSATWTIGVPYATRTNNYTFEYSSWLEIYIGDQVITLPAVSSTESGSSDSNDLEMPTWPVSQSSSTSSSSNNNSQEWVDVMNVPSTLGKKLFQWNDYLKYVHCVAINGKTFASIANYPMHPEWGFADEPLEYQTMNDEEKHEWAKAFGTNVLVHDTLLKNDMNKGLSADIADIDYVINVRPISA